jgi:hypothetical protein
MNLQEALKVLEEKRDELRQVQDAELCGVELDLTAALTTAIDALAWKSVETLPEEDGMYLVAIKSPAWLEILYGLADMRNGEWIRTGNIAAWMPIPQYGGKDVR